MESQVNRDAIVVFLLDEGANKKNDFIDSFTSRRWAPVNNGFLLFAGAHPTSPIGRVSTEKSEIDETSRKTPTEELRRESAETRIRPWSTCRDMRTEFSPCAH